MCNDTKKKAQKFNPMLINVAKNKQNDKNKKPKKYYTKTGKKTKTKNKKIIFQQD